MEENNQWKATRELVESLKRDLYSIGLLYETLPKSSQEKITKRITKIKYANRIGNRTLALQLNLSSGISFRIELIDMDREQRWNATIVGDLYDAFRGKEAHWNYFVLWIHRIVLPQINADFDNIFRAEIKKMNSDTLELVEKLRLARVTSENLEETITQNIPKLQKVAQELRDTKGFLGHSKTIKSIRENVGTIVANLWYVVYEGDPPQIWDGKGKPIWPRSPQKLERATRGYNPVPPDGVQRPDPIPHVPPKR